MAKVINLQKARAKRENSESRDLTELLRQASTICKEKHVFPEGLSIIGKGQLQNVFERKISEEIFARRLISRDIFLCGIYVSKILAELASTNPESWWAVDYAFSDTPATLKKGGDMCFAICGIFPQRGNRRAMKISYYQEMGEGFYYHFFGRSKKEIGYHMCNNFETMVEVVQKCVQGF